LSQNIESTSFTARYQALRINTEFIDIARTESKKIIKTGHVVASDIQDVVGIEGDNTYNSNPESP
jgi:hypothetical protein